MLGPRNWPRNIVLMPSTLAGQRRGESTGDAVRLLLTPRQLIEVVEAEGIEAAEPILFGGRPPEPSHLHEQAAQLRRRWTELGHGVPLSRAVRPPVASGSQSDADASSMSGFSARKLSAASRSTSEASASH